MLPAAREGTQGDFSKSMFIQGKKISNYTKSTVNASNNWNKHRNNQRQPAFTKCKYVIY